MDSVAWVSWIVGGVLALLGVGVAAWSVRGDRSRGRRRCPRCWYDMSKVPGMTCPECGRTPRSERRFARTRRRWTGLVWAGAFGLLGLVAALTPAAYTGKWVKYTPVPVLKAVVERFRADAASAYATAVQSNGGPSAAATLSSWERLLIASECARKFAAFRELSPDQRATAMAASSERWMVFRTGPRRTVEQSSPDGSGRVYDEALTASEMLTALGGESVIAGEELLNMLADADRMMYGFAAMPIEGLKTSAGYLTPGLLRLARQSRSETARLNAIMALAFVTAPPSGRVSACLYRLIDSDESPDVRAAAMFAAVAIDPSDERLFPALAGRAAGDDVGMVRLHAMELFEPVYDIPRSQLVDPLVFRGQRVRWDGSMELDLWSIASLFPASRLPPDRRFMPLCEQLLADENSEMRERSAFHLDSFGIEARQSIPAIDAALVKETDSAAKQALLQAFLHIEAGPRSVQLLTESLEDPKLAERTLRWAFAELGRLGPAASPAVPTIERFIASHSFSLVFAVETLAQIGEAGLPQLLKTLGDERDGVRIMAASALVRDSLRTCGVTDQLLPLMNDTSTAVRLYLSRTLAKCPEQWGRVHPVIVDSMKREASVSARMEYVEVLARFGAAHPDEMVPIVAGALEDESWQVRLVAAQQLGLVGSEASRAAEALAKATRDTDESVRAAARAVIEKLMETR